MSHRITFVTDIPTPYMNAVFAVLAERCELTVLFCSRSGTRAMAWELPELLPFRHRVVGGPVIRRWDQTDLYLDPRMFAAIARSQPDAIISGGFSSPSLYAAAYSRLTGVPLVIHSDGTSRSEATFGRARRVTRRLLASAAAGAAANSRAAAQRFAELGWPAERIHLAPHSTMVEPFHRVARARIRRAGSDLDVLHVGRLIPRKGVDRLIAAAATARDGGADVRLIVVGSGPEEEPLRAQAQASRVPVEWRGFVDQPDLPAEYARADAFAFPTIEDPFGIVLLEAAAAGLPLVASPHAGATLELVADGESGFVVEPDDRERFAAALSALASDPELRAKMGAAAYDRTRDRTPESTAWGYLRAVDAALMFKRRHGAQQPAPT